MGYTNSYEVLDAREFGLPQARERVFTVSTLEKEKFRFDDLVRTPMRNIREFLECNEEVSKVYDVTQPSVKAVIGATGSVRRATIIKDYARYRRLGTEDPRGGTYGKHDSRIRALR